MTEPGGWQSTEPMTDEEFATFERALQRARGRSSPGHWEWGVWIADLTISDWNKPETLRLETRWDSLSPAYTEETARQRAEELCRFAGPDFARPVRRWVSDWELVPYRE